MTVVGIADTVAGGCFATVRGGIDRRDSDVIDRGLVNQVAEVST